MANTIQIKRKTNAGAPSSLADGELALNTTDDKLYIGNSGVSEIDYLNKAGGTLSGNLGINTGASTPAQKLHIKDGGILMTDENAGQSMFRARNFATSATGSFNNTYGFEYRHATSGGVNHAALIHLHENNSARKILTVSSAFGTVAEFASNGTCTLASPTISGTATVTSWLYPNNGLSIPDSKKILLGNQSDLEIYHDGSDNHSYIKESGSGHLYIQATNLRLQSAAGGNILEGVAGGVVRLYHNDVKKFETTSTGAEVSGALTASALYASANGVALGTTSNGWRLYSNNADVSGTLTVTGTTNLSGNTTSWVNIGGINAFKRSNAFLYLGNGGWGSGLYTQIKIRMADGYSIAPYSATPSASTTLGTSSYRWPTIYGAAGNFSGIVSTSSSLLVNATSNGGFGTIENRQAANTNASGIATVQGPGGDNSLRLWVDSSGNRKINAGTTEVISFTTSAISLLQPTTLSSSLTTGGHITINADNATLRLNDSTSGSNFNIFSNGNELRMAQHNATFPGAYLNLTTAGNLGLGVTGASERLEVAGKAIFTDTLSAANANDELFAVKADYGSATTNGSFGGFISFYHRTGGNLLQSRVNIGIVGQSNNAADLIFRTSAGAGSTPATRLTITSAGDSKFTGHVLPSASATYNLGTSSNRWATIYGAAGNFSGNVTLNSRLTFSYNSHYFEAGTNSVAFKNSSGTSYLSVNNTGTTVSGNLTVGGTTSTFGSNGSIILKDPYAANDAAIEIKRDAGANSSILLHGEGDSYIANGITGGLAVGSASPSGFKFQVAGTAKVTSDLTVGGNLLVGSTSTANTTIRINNSLTAGSDAAVFSFGLDNSSFDFAGMRLDYSDRVTKGLELFTAAAYGYPITITPSTNKDIALNTSGTGKVTSSATIRVGSSPFTDYKNSQQYSSGTYSVALASGSFNIADNSNAAKFTITPSTGAASFTNNLTVGGTTILNGNVSINHSYNGQSLNISGNIYTIGGSNWVNNGQGFVSSSSTNTGVYPHSTSGVSLNVAGSTKFNVNSTGASVTDSLTVGGATTWAGQDSQTCAIYLNNTGRGLYGNFANHARNLVKANSQYVEIGQNSTLVYGVKFIVGSNAANGFMFQSNIGGTMTTHMGIRGDTGSVGIGTGGTAPYAYDTTATKFEVSTGTTTVGEVEVARFRGGDDADTGAAIVRITNDNDRGLVLKGGRTGTAAFADIGVSSWDGSFISSLRVDGAGQVGVGTIPSEKLHVSGNVRASQYLTTTGNNRTKIKFWGTNTDFGIGMYDNHTYGGLDDDYCMTFQFSNHATRGFWWGDSSHTNAQGAMALTTDGKLTVAHSMRLGFGESDTTAPGSDATLHVQGTDSRFTAASPTTAAHYLRLKHDNTEGVIDANRGNLKLQANDDVYTTNNFGIGVAPAATLHVQASAPEFRLSTASSAVVRLRTSGDNYINTGQNLGIGTASPSAKLHVNGTSYFGNNISGADADYHAVFGRAKVGYIGWADYAGFAHRDSSSQTNYALLQSSTGATFLNSASGATLYFRQNNENVGAVASGNWGLGTISPGSYKLYVNGTSYFSQRILVDDDIDFQSRGDYITFYGDSSRNHAIASRDSSGNAADDLRINSYGALYVNLDSNNNNSSGANFEIGKHGGEVSISEWLFTLFGETGKLKLHTYGSGNHTGTVEKYLGVTSAGVVVEADGTGSSYSLPFASDTTLGGIKIDGNDFTINSSTAVMTLHSTVTKRYSTYVQMDEDLTNQHYTINHGLGTQDVVVQVRTYIAGTYSRAQRFSGVSGVSGGRPHGRHLDIGHDVDVVSCDANGTISGNHISLDFTTYMNTVGGGADGEYLYVAIIG